VRSADEMHEALTGLACITVTEARNNEGWPAWLAPLAESGRATRLRISGDDTL
jgi:ATP-dependent helicase Lhr and Lhr-like helicase